MTTWDADALAELACYAQDQGTTGLLVVCDRQTVLERNWPVAAGNEVFAHRYLHGTAADGALREDVASQQKSVVALLAAMAADRGLLDIDRPVADHVGLGWSRATPAEEAAIRVCHLLEMCSGLDDDLAYCHPAGVHHYYNTPAYALLLPVLAAAAGLPLEALTQAWLTGPAGMADTFWCRRSDELTEHLGNPRGLVTTPRDLARLGQLVLDGGVTAGGQRLVSTARLAGLFTRTALNPAYGRLWWLNGGSHWIVPRKGQGAGNLVATAPADAVFALGSENRVLMVVPSLRLVLVRLGQQAPDPDLREQLAQRVLDAMAPQEGT